MRRGARWITIAVAAVAVAVTAVLLWNLASPDSGGTTPCGGNAPAESATSSGSECVSGQVFTFETVAIPSNYTLDASFGGVEFAYEWATADTPAGRALGVNGTWNGVTVAIYLSDGPPGPAVDTPVLSPGHVWGAQWGPEGAPGVRLLVATGGEG
jgi:hypothetical protein